MRRANGSGKANNRIIQYSKQSQIDCLFEQKLFHIKPTLIREQSGAAELRWAHKTNFDFRRNS